MASELTMPQLGLTMTEGIVSRWLKSEGDTVHVGDEIVEVETDKINNIVESPEDGVLLKIIAEEGETLPVKGILGYIGKADEKIEAAAKVSEADKAIEISNRESDKKTCKKKVCVEDGWVPATPYARYLARENNVDLHLVSGSDSTGRIVGDDVKYYLEGHKIKISPVAAKIAAEHGIEPGLIDAERRIMKSDVIAVLNPEEKVSVAVGEIAKDEASVNKEKLKGMRKVIAQRLTESWQNTPHVHHTVEIDMTAAKRLKVSLADSGRKISYTDLIIKAYSRVLREYPAANNWLVDDYIVHNDEICMGVAVAVDNGLIVPVIKNSDILSLSEIHDVVGTLADKARKGSLSPDEMKGGTSTISNLGMYGCDHFTPIVNPPEACILGICRTVDKPVVRNGEIVAAPVMNAVLGYDHRIIDGAVAGRITARFREYMENPFLLL